MEVPYVSVMNKHEAPWLGGWEVAPANHQLSRHGVGAIMEWVTTTMRGEPGGGMVWAEAWEEGGTGAWSLVLTRGTHL